MALMLQCTLGTYTGLTRSINSLPARQVTQNRYVCHLSSKQNPSSALSPLMLWGEKNLNVSKTGKEDRWRVRMADEKPPSSTEPAPAAGGNSPPLETQALILGQEFYIAINSKIKEKLNPILSQTCMLPGIVYYFSYGGKQNVVNYLGNVMEAMGSNINIVAEKLEFIPKTDASMYPTLRVNWQLEWMLDGKPNVIPLVGCNEFSFDKVEGKLLISSIRGVQEFPVKPRELMLQRMPISAASLPKLLKAIGSVIDSSQAAKTETVQKFQASNQLLVPLLEMLSAYTNNMG